MTRLSGYNRGSVTSAAVLFLISFIGSARSNAALKTSNGDLLIGSQSASAAAVFVASIANSIKAADVAELITTSNTDRTEYCEAEEFRASCRNPGQVILMDYSMYGRMRVGRCVDRDYGYIGCSTDVLRLTDRRCSGRRSCVIPVPNSEFKETQGCPKDLKPYFEANYSCIRVQEAADQTCLQSRFLLVDSSKSGFIASVVTQETGRGSTECPWLIQARPGQQVDIVLWDFARSDPSTRVNEVAVHHHHHHHHQQPQQQLQQQHSVIPNTATSHSTGDPFDVCRVYAVVKEHQVGQTTSYGIQGTSAESPGTSGASGTIGSGGARGVTICAGDSRQRHVYTSSGHAVQVRIVHRTNSKAVAYDAPGADFFLLQYAITGCADPALSDGMVLVRNRTHAALYCSNSVGQWQLTCVESLWIGTVGNCSDRQQQGLWKLSTSEVPRLLNYLSFESVFISFEMSLVVVISLAVGIGVVVLIIGIVFLSRSRKSRHTAGAVVPITFTSTVSRLPVAHQTPTRQPAASRDIGRAMAPSCSASTTSGSRQRTRPFNYPIPAPLFPDARPQSALHFAASGGLRIPPVSMPYHDYSTVENEYAYISDLPLPPPSPPSSSAEQSPVDLPPPEVVTSDGNNSLTVQRKRSSTTESYTSGGGVEDVGNVDEVFETRALVARLLRGGVVDHVTSSWTYDDRDCGKYSLVGNGQHDVRHSGFSSSSNGGGNGLTNNGGLAFRTLAPPPSLKSVSTYYGTMESYSGGSVLPSTASGGGGNESPKYFEFDPTNQNIPGFTRHFLL